MTADLLIFTYYYKYKQSRQLIRDLVSNDNLTEAKNKLDPIVEEHNNYINDRGIVNDATNFTSQDNYSLRHAKVHLDALIRTGQTHQKGATVDALNAEGQ